MGWLRIDDGFSEHPKVIGLSDRSFRLHFAALCFCNRNLTDGGLNDRAVRVVCALTSATRRHVTELRDAGLWVQSEDGYRINDYLDFNPSRDEVLAKRAVRSAAGRAGGQQSGKRRRRKNEANGSPATRSKTEAFASVAGSSKGGSTPAPKPSSEADASAAATTELVEAGGETAQQLVGGFVDAAKLHDVELPRRVIGQTARAVKQLLDEGQPAEAVRAGLERMAERRIMQPSLLPNFVAEAALPVRNREALRYGRGMTTEQILAETRGAA